jgi:hypothetical protein
MSCFSSSFIDTCGEALCDYATNSLQLEMLIGKLQLIATSTASNHMKVTWLIWWNSSTPTRLARRFLEAPVGEERLTPWLGKACWYAGVSSN